MDEAREVEKAQRAEMGTYKPLAMCIAGKTDWPAKNGLVEIYAQLLLFSGLHCRARSRAYRLRWATATNQEYLAKVMCAASCTCTG